MFGQLLRKFRKRKMLPKSLADNIGVESQAYIALLENSQTLPPTFDVCKKIVSVLEIPLEDQDHFYRTALDERLSDETKKYQKHLGISFSNMTSITRDVAVSTVPLLRFIPNNKHDIDTIDKVKYFDLDPVLANDNCFAILYCDGWGIMDQFGFLPGDVLIIDPKSEVKQYDPILATIEGVTRLYRYEQIESIFLFQSCVKGIKNYTFTLNDLSSVHIIGKVVTTIKVFKMEYNIFSEGNTLYLSGFLRLMSPYDYNEPFALIKESLEGEFTEVIVDITKLSFLNSSGITALAKLILLAKKNNIVFILRGSEEKHWQKKSFDCLTKLYDQFLIEWAK